MAIERIEEAHPQVYVILGIDQQANDQVLGVYETYKDAMDYCTKNLAKTPSITGFFDIWIEKHFVM